MLKQEIKEKITQKSISLEEYGFNDLAWNKEDAEDLIHEIMKDEIGILGGRTPAKSLHSALISAKVRLGLLSN